MRKIFNNKVNSIIIIFIILMYIATLSLFSDLPLSIFNIIVLSAIGIFFLKNVKINLITWMFILFFLWAIFVSLFSSEVFDAIKLSLLLGISTCIFLLLVNTIENTKKNILLENVLFVYVVLQSINALYGVVIKIFGESVTKNGEYVFQLKLGFLEFNSGISGTIYSPRLASLFENPNTFGLYSLIALIFIFLLYKKMKVSKKIFWLIASIQVIAIYFSFSRIVIALTILFLLSIGVIYSFRITYKKLVFIASFFIVVSLMLVMKFSDIIIALLNSRFSKDSNGRDVAWDLLLKYIGENILTGAGFGQAYAVVLAEYIEYGAHNIYLLILAETGIIGLVIFLFLLIIPIFYAVLKAIASYKKNNLNLFYTYIVFAIFISILAIHQIFETQLMRISLVHYLWIFILGILFSQKRENY